MDCLGEVRQTPAEMAHCHGHHIPFIGCSSLPRDLFLTKRSLARSIIPIYYKAILQEHYNEDVSSSAVSDVESKLADMWAKTIGLETLREIITPSLSVPPAERILMLLAHWGQEMQYKLDDIKDILSQLLNEVLSSSYLLHPACYLLARSDMYRASRKLSTLRDWPCLPPRNIAIS